MTLLLQGLGPVAVATAVALAILYFSMAKPLPLPNVGERSVRRRAALELGGPVRFFDGTMRHVAARVATWPTGALRTRIEQRLAAAGWPMGLGADEAIAWAVLLLFGGGIGGALFGACLSHPVVGCLAGVTAAVGGLWARLDAMGRRRLVESCRGLPAVIDLIALSMRAGLDFGGALERVVAGLRGDDPLRFELEHVMHKLSLGWGRARALESMAERIPHESVRDFVGAVVQADRRGNPLAVMLATQAGVLRLRRSQRAEEAAARAGVLMLGPLMLIFVCVFLILLGPFILRTASGGIL